MRIFFLCLLLTAVSLADTLTETNFSYTVPAGWKITTFAGSKYKLTYGPVTSAFAPNINVVEEVAPVTLPLYADRSKQLLAKSSAQYKLLGSGPFVTTGGLQGIKLVTRAVREGKSLGQTFYLFAGKNNLKYVVTCSCDVKVSGQLAPTFDKSMKTFAIK